MEQLAAVPWEAIGLSGMAVFGVYLVLTGKIHSDSAMKDTRKERDDWKSQVQARDVLLDRALETNETLTRALERLTGSKEMSTALLQAVRRGTTTEQEEETP